MPEDEAGRLHALQLQLTVADLVDEAHDTHHPIPSAQYYEEQREAANARAAHFREARMPKYLGFFERTLAQNGGRYLVGEAVSYVDLSVFQVMRGLATPSPSASPRSRRTPRAWCPSPTGWRRCPGSPPTSPPAAAALQRDGPLPPLPRARRILTKRYRSTNCISFSLYRGPAVDPGGSRASRALRSASARVILTAPRFSSR